MASRGVTLCIIVASFTADAFQLPAGGLVDDYADVMAARHLGAQAEAAGKVKSQLAKIGEQLDRKDKQDASDMTQLRTHLDKKLNGKLRRNAALQKENEQKASALSAVDAKNKELRRQAAQLLEDNELLRSQVKLIRSNLSVAEEFTNMALEDSERRARANELAVVFDLAQNETEQTEQEAKLSFIERVFGAQEQIVMLQHDDENDASVNDLVSSLATQLNELATSKIAAEARLQSEFEERQNITENQYKELLASSAELEQSLNASTKLNQQLVEAVHYLENEHTTLEDRLHSIAVFSARIAEWSAPAAESVENLSASFNSTVQMPPRRSSHHHRKKQEAANVTAQDGEDTDDAPVQGAANETRTMAKMFAHVAKTLSRLR